MHDFVEIADFSKPQLEQLIHKANHYVKNAPKPFLQHETVANLFFEPSTRTRCSFEIAAQKCGAKIINLDTYSSSIQKGETAIDTALNLQAMGVNFFVVRQKENGSVAELAQVLQLDSRVINAGCGTSQHPSQGLLDMLTIWQHKKDFQKLSVAIIGDMYHSRVAHSDIAALQILDVPDIRLIAPDSLLPENYTDKNITIYHDVAKGLKDVDVIMTLRLQKERMHAANIPDEEQFFKEYGLNAERLQLAKKDAIVMHPGPMNRGVEISSDVADGPKSVILQQAANGVAARMAIFEYCC